MKERKRKIEEDKNRGVFRAASLLFTITWFFLWSFEELQTVLIEVKLNINNARLTYDYPNTIKTYLTPNHFLFGRQLLYGLYDLKTRTAISMSVHENLYITHAQNQEKPFCKVLLHGTDVKLWRSHENL